MLHELPNLVLHVMAVWLLLNVLAVVWLTPPDLNGRKDPSVT